MWKITLSNIAKWIFTALPIETILAKAFTYMLQKWTKPEDMDKVATTINHCGEIIDLMASIVNDSAITKDEVKLATNELNSARADLIATWAKGVSGKTIEEKIATLETVPAK